MQTAYLFMAGRVKPRLAEVWLTLELGEEAVKLALAQGLTLEDAALRLTIPKGTLSN
jgi:predicted DNA-binding protein (UPF0251 family)